MYKNNLDIDWIDYSKAQDKCIDYLEKEVKEKDKSLKSLDKIIKLLTILVFQAKEKVDEAKDVIKSCLVLLKKQKK